MGKVRSNLDFVNFLLSSGPRFLDWAITGYFYSAVHLAEAYFDRFGGRHHRKHQDRRMAIVSDTRVGSLYNSYRKLETFSQIARYEVKQFDLTYVSQRVVPRFKDFRKGVESIHPDLQV